MEIHNTRITDSHIRTVPRALGSPDSCRGFHRRTLWIRNGDRNWQWDSFLQANPIPIDDLDLRKLLIRRSSHFVLEITDDKVLA